ncbi:hypothetical protein H4R27_004929 [Coemansia aciculifera]|nr:hypothetical protein H4R27_004929 [Coemansia aciculifera]
MQHSATATDHHPPKPVANAYYQDSPSAHSAAGVAASNSIMGSWPGGDSQQYQQACNTDTACSSPLDTPLAKIMQQQHATSVAGANGVSGGSGGEPIVATAHPTPPQSAASHGFSNAHNPDAWRAYQNPYHQGIPVPGAYSAAAFASPISSGMPTGLDNGSFEHSAATADYYYANNGHPHQAQHQHPGQLTHSSGTMSAHQPNGIADMHQLHYQQSHAQAIGQYHHSQQQTQQQQQQHGQDQHQHHHHSQQQQQHHHQQQQSSQQQHGIHPHDPSSVSQFDHAAAAAVSAAAGNQHYMGDFGHGMYAGAQEIASAPASVMHLPPIDPASSLSRHNSYFSMAGSPGNNFDPMSAAAVAAAAAAAASAGPYSPHPAGQSQYMTAAAARGQQPYPSTMMIGRFNMGGMPSNSGPGAVPTPPPPASSMQSQHQPPPLGSSGSSMSVPSTPTRPIGMSRMNSHGQSSTTQRKRYLCTVCQKMFARPSTLSTHMHSHTGEKPYECTWDGCEKRFSVMSNLRRHQRIHERQRQKYANVQQQQHGQMQPTDPMASGDESSDESTTPLASQMHAVAAHGHHHRHQHHMSPPPGFNQPPMLASHAQGGMSASLGMHHHSLPSLHHTHQQQHQQQQPHPHHHQHHLMAPVASHQQQHYQHYQHQQPQPSMSDALTKHSVGPNSIHDDSATVVMSANEESVPMLNGASTASTNTISPTTPQSSGLKE